jgi:CHAD domain-containing protein
MAGLATRPRPLVLEPDDAATVAARAAVGQHLRSLTAAEGGARAGDVESVHQLRVATRRLRATLDLFAPVMHKTFVESAQRDLGWLGRAIGAVRDLDVLADAVAGRAAQLDLELRGALGPLTLAIGERRAAAHAALLGSLGSLRCRRLRAGLAAFADSPPPARRQERLGELAPDLVRPLLRHVLRAGRRIDADSPPEDLHRLRVRAKRLRYALETLRGRDGKPIAKSIRRLMRLQDVLGEHQDAITQITWLRRWAETATAPAPTLLALGALTQVLDARAAKRRRRFPAAWARFDRRRAHRRLVDALAAAQKPAPAEVAAP